MNEHKKLILEVGKYIVLNKATIEITAKHFNKSTSSIKKYINNELKNLDEELYNAVKLTQQKLINLGHSIGGKNGVREPKYSDFDAMEMAEVMISGSLTLEEAGTLFNIPTSTIYERIKSIKDDKIQESLNLLFLKNKKGKKIH